MGPWLRLPPRTPPTASVPEPTSPSVTGPTRSTVSARSPIVSTWAGSPTRSRSCSRTSSGTRTGSASRPPTSRPSPAGAVTPSATASVEPTVPKLPSPPNGSSCRTSPGCRAWSTSPPCETPSQRWGAIRRGSTRWSRWSWSSTTRSSPRCQVSLARTTRTSTSSTSATSSGTSCCAGPSRRSTGSGSCLPALASATRSTWSTCHGWCSPRRTDGHTATPWWAPTPTRPWSTGSACWAGESAASRLRQPCSANRCRCSSPRWSASG